MEREARWDRGASGPQKHHGSASHSPPPQSPETRTACSPAAGEHRVDESLMGTPPNGHVGTGEHELTASSPGSAGLETGLNGSLILVLRTGSAGFIPPEW